MRSLAAFLAGLIAVAAIVAALPTLWVTERVVDADGFRATATAMGQSAQVRTYHGRHDHQPGPAPRRRDRRALVAPFAQRYTQSPAFTEDFVDLASQQHHHGCSSPHRPASTRASCSSTSPTWSVALPRKPTRHSPSGSRAPILVPVSDRDQALEAGRYQQSGVQVKRLAYGSIVVGVIAAVLALLVSRRRGTTLVWLGLGGVLSAAASFAGGYYFSPREG